MYIHLLLYSKVCIELFGACPSCDNETYDTFLDEAINENLLPLEVQCKYYKKGCHWRNQLCFQEEHLKEECLFRKMEYCYGCDEKIHFCELEAHEKDECIQRPPEAKIETIEKRIVDLANEIAISRAVKQKVQEQVVAHEDYLNLKLFDEMISFERLQSRRDTKLDHKYFVDKKLKTIRR